MNKKIKDGNAIKDFYYVGKLKDEPIKWKLKTFMSGIYVLYMKTENKYYVGATINLLRRFTQHKQNYKNSKYNFDNIEVYIYQTANNFDKLEKLEYVAMEYMLDKIPEENLTNKIRCMNYNLKVKDFYHEETEFIRSLPKYNSEYNCGMYDYDSGFDEQYFINKIMNELDDRMLIDHD